MEELHSTEALDREILEDARKKAFKILKNADESLLSSKAAWDRKLEKTREKIRKKYSEKDIQNRKEISARFPMDKQRIRSETIDRFLNKAMEAFLLSLDRPSLLRIMKNELKGRKTEMGAHCSGEGELRYRSLSKEECSALVSDFFPETAFTFSEDPLYMAAGSFPALMIDFPRMRVAVSVDRAAQELLMEKRAELAAALLGNIEDITFPPSINDNEKTGGTPLSLFSSQAGGGGNG